MRHPPLPPSTRPLEAVPLEAEVVLMGDRVSASLTPEAALASAEQIRQAAEEVIRRRKR